MRLRLFSATSASGWLVASVVVRASPTFEAMIIATIGTIRKVSRRRSGERRGGWSSGVGWTWPEASFSSASGSGANAGQTDISYTGFHDALDGKSVGKGQRGTIRVAIGGGGVGQKKKTN